MVTEELEPAMKSGSGHLRTMRSNYHLVQCQYCPNLLERALNVDKATCFDCRKRKQIERDSLRADEIRERRRKKYLEDKDKLRKKNNEAVKRHRARKIKTLGK